MFIPILKNYNIKIKKKNKTTKILRKLAVHIKHFEIKIKQFKNYRTFLRLYITSLIFKMFNTCLTKFGVLWV